MFKPDAMLEYAAPGEPSLVVKAVWSFARICGGIAGTIVCAMIGASLPHLWEAAGRDFRPTLTNVAVLIFLFATACRGLGRFRLLEMAASLLGVELLILGIIGRVSGMTGTELFDGFNLTWLWGISMFVAPPWLLGMAAGSGVLWLRGPSGQRAFEKTR